MALSKIKTDSLADDAVTQAKIADNAVTAQMISDGTIAAADLASSAVTNAKLSANAVTNIKVDASAAIAASKLDLSTITGPISITRANGIATTINRSGSAGTSLKVETGNVDITAGTLTMNGSTVIANNRAITGTNITATGSISSTDGGTALTLGVLSNATTLPALNFNGAFASSAMTGLYGNGVTASNLYYTVPSSKEHIFSIADSQKMVLNSSGNLGIGTSSPDQPLDIAYTKNLAYSVDNFTNSDNSGLRIENTSTTANAFSNLTFRVGSGADLFFGIEQKSANDGDFIFANQNSPDIEMMRITSDGNVAIGVTSKNSANNGSLTIGHTGMTKITGTANGNADELVLIGANASANVGMSIISNNANQGIIYFGDEDDTDRAGFIYDHNGDYLAINTNALERMRIDSSGNVFIGNTAEFVDGTASTAIGIQLNPIGLVISTRNQGISGIFGRQDTDGDILQFRRNGSAIGSLGVDNTDNLTISGNSSHCGLNFSDNSINPYKNGAYTNGTTDLGHGTTRFKDIYLSGGVNFSANANASGMSSELLDDYEEGTWTPTLVSTGASFQYSVQNGYYTKIGQCVTFTCIIQLDGGGNSFSGNSLALNGWPFQSKTNAHSRFFISTRYVNIDLGNGYTYVYAHLSGNSSSATIHQSGDNVPTSTINSNNLSSSSGQLYLHGHYITDS